MKYLMIVPLLILFWQNVPERYQVCYVSQPGKICYARNGKPVRLEDEVTLNERLNFLDPKAHVVVFNAAKGRREIRYKENFSGRIMEIIQLIFPPSKVRSFSVKSGTGKGLDPQKYFSAEESGQKILLVETQKFPVNDDYQLDDHHFFFLQYEVNGQRRVKKVPQDGSNVIFSRELFETSGPPVEKYSLCYQSVEGGEAESRIIAKFDPVIVDAAELRSALRVIVVACSQKSVQERNDIILSHFYETYGKTDMAILKPLFPDDPR